MICVYMLAAVIAAAAWALLSIIGVWAASGAIIGGILLWFACLALATAVAAYRPDARRERRRMK